MNGTTDNIATVNAGTQFCFELFSTDSDPGDSVYLSWNNAISSATFVSDSAKHPAGTFCWTPSLSDIRSYPYIFTATIRDNWCPMNIVQIYTYAIYVTDNPSPLFLYSFHTENNNKPIIYPNPSSGVIHIESAETIASVTLYDHAGRFIKEEKSGSSVYNINEPSGLYLIEVLYNDGRTLKQKIIKK
jgi:hypothetical protein